MVHVSNNVTFFFSNLFDLQSVRSALVDRMVTESPLYRLFQIRSGRAVCTQLVGGAASPCLAIGPATKFSSLVPVEGHEEGAQPSPVANTLHLYRAGGGRVSLARTRMDESLHTHTEFHKYCQIVFQNDCTGFFFHQRCRVVPVSLRPPHTWYYQM